jgi:hypothetical protein
LTVIRGLGKDIPTSSMALTSNYYGLICTLIIQENWVVIRALIDSKGAHPSTSPTNSQVEGPDTDEGSLTLNDQATQPKH